MKNGYAYSLKPPGIPNKEKHTCPDCKRLKTFKRYVHSETGEYLNDDVGICDRIDNCGYHFTPGDYFKENPDNKNYINYNQRSFTLAPPKPLTYNPQQVFHNTLKGYDKNGFITGLLKHFSDHTIQTAIEAYYLGTDSRWKAGAVTFPFIDEKNNVRAIQVVEYNAALHRKAANFIHAIEARQFPQPDWLKDYTSNETYVSCFFGAHLLARRPDDTIALCEAPKTAIIGSIYFPGYVWLATYSVSTFTADRCKALAGREIIVFPDCKQYENWGKTAKAMEKLYPKTRYTVSDLLEKGATETERKDGLDLADYLLRFPLNGFAKEGQVSGVHWAKKNPTINKISTDNNDTLTYLLWLKTLTNGQKIHGRDELSPYERNAFDAAVNAFNWLKEISRAHCM